MNHRPNPTSSQQGLRLLSVVVPVYNEVATFRQILKRIADVPLAKEIILVDDGSTDGTRDLLRQIESEAVLYPNSIIKVIFHEKNQGKGAALRTGIQQATGDLLIVQDADLEYSPEEYPRLIEPILSGDADVVFGSRFRGDRVRVLFFWHMLGNRLLTFLSNMCTNLNLTDMETCYKVFKTEIIKNIPLRSDRFGFEPEITAKMSKLGLSIYEVPISYRGRTYAEGKKINWKDGISAIFTILKFWLLDDLYNETSGLNTVWIMQGAGQYNRWLFLQCEPSLGKRILEVGAGAGNFTKYLTSRDRVVATDINDFFITSLRRRYQYHDNVAVEKLDLSDRNNASNLTKAHRPDSVLAVNVLAYIENQELALKNINTLLPIGGNLTVVVPAHPALFSSLDVHLGHKRRYGKNELKDLLINAGFEIQSMRYLNLMGALAWLINGKILRRKLLPTQQIRIFDWLVGLLKFEKWVSLPFGLSVLVVAKKKSPVESF
ncbi:MAG: Undecaprenyl-phosphate 4-deoxy-4-formamido-L-arabinose transferase [Elusimicrobia bacterium]|nr:Undecaprenyl-phosphate 4-deoxy-4-formamido-L-arabinose transferase [Elusimicrobiota bacterium]